MLRKGLLAAAGNQGDSVEFLGSVSANGTQTGSVTPYDIDLTSLSLQEGDLLILSNAADGIALVPGQISNGGWTQLYAASSLYGDGDVLYKFMGPTPDSDISLGTSQNAVICSAFRNANTFIQHNTEVGGTGNPDPLSTAATTDSQTNSPYVAGVTFPAGYDNIYPDVVSTAISSFISSNPPSTDDIVYIIGALDDDQVADTVTAPSGFTLVGAENATDGLGATAMAAYRYGTGSAINPNAFSSTGTDAWTASTLVLRSLNSTATPPTIDGERYAGSNVASVATVSSSDDNGSRLTVDLSNLSSVIGQANALAVVCVGGVVTPSSNSVITNTSSTIFGQPGTNRYHQTILNGAYYGAGAGLMDVITAEIPSGTSNTQITINYDRFTVSARIFTFILNGLDSNTPIFNSSTGPSTFNGGRVTLTPSAGGEIGIYMGLAVGDDIGPGDFTINASGQTSAATSSYGAGQVDVSVLVTTGNNTSQVAYDPGGEFANSFISGITFT